jgi:hypothetical protein
LYPLAKWKFVVTVNPVKYKLAETARQEAKQGFGVARPHTFLLCSENEIRKDDRILFSDSKAGDVQWMIADFIVRVKPSDGVIYDRKYPYQAVQVHRDTIYPTPPFKIDVTFRKALAKAIEEYGEDRLYDVARPPQRLLSLVRKRMDGQG